MIVVMGFAAGRFGVTIVSLALALILAAEQLRLARAGGVRPVAAIGLATVAALVIAGHMGGARAARWLPPIAAAGLALAYVAMLRRHVRTNVTRALIATALPILTAGLLAAFVPALRASGGPRASWGFLLLVLGASLGTAIAHRAGAGQALVFGASALGALVVAAGLAVTWSGEYEAGRAMALGLVVAVCVPLGRVLASRVEADLQGADTRRHARALHQLGGALLSAPAFFFVFRALTT